MELSDKVGGVLKVGGRLPGGCVVALLLDEVLEAIVVEAAVKYGLNLPQLLPIDDDGWWRWCYLFWVWILGGMLQERDMEDGVDLDRSW